MERPVRVRFAPSPTGPLHIGGVRTALYNHLFARRHKGTMILRIEDTDSQRFVPGAEDYILESLKWCGIEIDEGVGVGGPHAPYRQSERREIYLKYALQLVEAGWAYYAFDTAEELDALRREAEARGEAFAYNYAVREKLATSLALPAEEVKARLDRGDQWVIRFRMPENETVAMDDLIRGHVEVNTSTLDDKVLYKSADALPTYHLANIVDDRLMEVSHVIRGEELRGGGGGTSPAARGACRRCRCTTSCTKPSGGRTCSPGSPTCPCCSNPRAAASSRSATATRWDSRYFRSSGPLRRVRPPTATARTAISPRRSSTCWRCWAGTPARSRRSSRCRS